MYNTKQKELGLAGLSAPSMPASVKIDNYYMSADMNTTITWLFSRWFYVRKFRESVLAKISTRIYGYL